MKTGHCKLPWKLQGNCSSSHRGTRAGWRFSVCFVYEIMNLYAFLSQAKNGIYILLTEQTYLQYPLSTFPANIISLNSSQITHVARLSTPKQIINWDLLLIYEHMLYWARATIWGNLFSRALDRRREDWSRVFRMDSNSRCTGLKCPPPPQYICPAGHVGLGQNFLRSRFSVDRLLKTELIWFCVEHLFPSEYP